MTTAEVQGTTRIAAPTPRPVAALVVAIVVAFVLYRPDRVLPFDILDFSEFLPLLRSTESFWGRASALIEYYADHGRANLLPYLLMASKWELFETWSPGWQWSRFIVMIGVVVLGFQLLKRLGATSLSALAGASVFLVVPAAARGWIRLTMGEPLGTLFLLALCLTILPSRRLRMQPWRWASAAFWTTCILLTKEMLAAALLLPLVLLLLTHEDGNLRAPSLSRPVGRFFLLLSVLGTVCLVPMIWLVVTAPTDAFATQFGATVRPVEDTLAAWFATLIPVDPVYGFPAQLIGVVLLLTLVLVVGGWWLLLRGRSMHLGYIGLGVIGLLFPLFGAIVYLPWPAYQQFYAIPFLIGTSILFAFALTGLELFAPRWWAIAAYAWWGGLLFVAAIDAKAQASRAAAVQQANDRLIRRVSALGDIDSVWVPSNRSAPQSWQGLGATLGRHAAAIGSPWPPVRDVPCDGIDSLGRIPPATAVVYYSSLCPRARDTDPIVERYARVSLRKLALVSDSLRIDVKMPPVEEAKSVVR